jgi:hypothetical protein
MEKYGTAGQATDYNLIRRMRIACWTPKVTETHSEYVMFVCFWRDSPQCGPGPPHSRRF